MMGLLFPQRLVTFGGGDGEESSSSRPLLCGVPQDLTLSRLLLNIYMKLLNGDIYWQIYISTLSFTSDVVKVFTQQWRQWGFWMGMNKLYPNLCRNECFSGFGSLGCGAVTSILDGASPDKIGRQSGIPLDITFACGAGSS